MSEISDLRAKAAQARRWAASLGDEVTVHALKVFAHELEQAAEKLERAESGLIEPITKIPDETPKG